MDNRWPALIVAVVLVIFGVFLMASHVRTRRRLRGDSRLEDNDQAFFDQRHRRRMRIAALFVILGILIGVGDALLPMHKQQPLAITLYWIGVLLLTGWVMVLGVGDFWSTAVHTAAEFSRIRQKRQEFEQQLVEFKHRHLGNRELDDHAES